MIERITSLHNPSIKQAIRLHTSRGRQSQDRIIVFGTREVERAVDAGIEFEEMFIPDSETDQWISSIQSRSPKKHSTRMIRLNDSLFSKVTYGDRTEGVVGVASRPETKLENIDLDGIPASALVLVVQAIEKPGNLGAIIRTADACGVSALICVDPLTDLFHPNSIRSSTGVVFNIPLATGSSAQVQGWLRENHFQVFTAILDDSNDFFQCDLTGRVAIVLGNEANGLDGQWQGKGFTAVKLPMRGQADSLNVSVTASVMMYEALRQREDDR